MIKLFEQFGNTWKAGDLAMISIQKQNCYFITDSNRPSHREFAELEAIIKLQAIDRSTNQKWIGEIVWVGSVHSTDFNKNQILGISLERAMIPGSGNNGGRKINRLLVNESMMNKNDSLAQQILTFDDKTYKTRRIIPLNSQVYDEDGTPIQSGNVEYRSDSSRPIRLRASLAIGQPATLATSTSIPFKTVIIPSNIFSGDRSETTYDSYVRMLNQMGLNVAKAGTDVYKQELSLLTRTFVFANNRTAKEFKEYLDQKIKEFPKIGEDLSQEYIDRGEDTIVQVFKVDDNSKWSTKILINPLSPLDLKNLSKAQLGDEIDNADVMGGEETITDLLEKTKA